MSDKEKSLEASDTGRLSPIDSEPIMQFFNYDHLPAKLQLVSKPFADLADTVLQLPRCAERSVALRKLLESKDAAVRAMIFKPNV